VRVSTSKAPVSEAQVRPPDPFVQQRLLASQTRQVVNGLVALVLAQPIQVYG
jgi:hypothetical protein